MVRLHVNVDHVATLRQARGTAFPDPVEAAVLCEHAGADGITVHLREDRRHVQDRDVEVLRRTVKTLLNLEMAATEEMVTIAKEIRPDLVTLVPERRAERTTEGGLNVVGQRAQLHAAVEALRAVGIPVSLFIDPDADAVRASVGLNVQAIELHTGDYSHAAGAVMERELSRLAGAATLARGLAPGLVVAAGHGLTRRNVRPLVAAVPELEELNIGHALIADAVFAGLPAAVQGFLAAIRAGEQER